MASRTMIWTGTWPWTPGPTRGMHPVRGHAWGNTHSRLAVGWGAPQKIREMGWRIVPVGAGRMGGGVGVGPV